MLHMDLLQGERVNIDNGKIVIEVGPKTGKRTRLSIEADRSIPVKRVAGGEDVKRSRDPPGDKE
jgi:hypothetical protein